MSHKSQVTKITTNTGEMPACCTNNMYPNKYCVFQEQKYKHRTFLYVVGIHNAYLMRCMLTEKV